MYLLFARDNQERLKQRGGRGGDREREREGGRGRGRGGAFNAVMEEQKKTMTL